MSWRAWWRRGRRGSRSPRQFVFGVAALTLALTLVPGVPAGGAESPTTRSVVAYRLPVGGDVVRGYSPPVGFGAGAHRGVDLTAGASGTVRVAAAGVVSFAGSVAGTTWVSVRHADGVSTTYGPLAAVRVAAGTRIAAGRRLGEVADGLHDAPHGEGDVVHFGARDADGYLDPLTLISAPPRPSLVGAGRWRGAAPTVTAYEPWEGGRFGGWLTHPSPDAERPGYATAPTANHVVVIAGLGTSSQSDVLDPRDLGYAPENISRFSYAGPSDRAGVGDQLPAHAPYGPRDTWSGPVPAAQRLAEHLVALRERRPGQAIDVIAHSMGGLTALEYLLEHHDVYDVDVPPVANIVTFATPMRGSDVATLGEVLVTDPGLGRPLAAVQRFSGVGMGHVALDSAAVADLAVGSPFLDGLADRWEAEWSARTTDLPTGALAMTPRLLTVGGSTDPVVPADRAAQPGPRWSQAAAPRERVVDGEVVVAHRVLPGGHGGVVRTQAAREVAYEFLSGQVPVESPGRISSVVGRGIGTVSTMLLDAVDRIRDVMSW